MVLHACSFVTVADSTACPLEPGTHVEVFCWRCLFLHSTIPSPPSPPLSDPPPRPPHTQVNYVGKAANLYADAGYELSGAAYVVEKYLGTSWLWDKVRVVGGAYGGFCSFDSHSGMFTYLSYRGE